MVCSGNCKKLSCDKILESKKKRQSMSLYGLNWRTHVKEGQLFCAMDIAGLQGKKADKQRAAEMRARKYCQASCRFSMSSSIP